MNWQRIGRIFTASGQFEWMNSHTACPVPYRIDERRYRIYFGTRNTSGHPSVGSLLIDLEQPTAVLQLSDAPQLTHGARGMFDDNGVYPGPILKVNGQDCMYYMGRSNGEDGLYYMSVGLAGLTADGQLARLFKAPVLGRSEHDPWMTSTPCVLERDGLFRMWYLSGIGWDSASVSRYHIKYAESADGVTWQRDGRVAIDFEPGETNIASPAVWQENGKYHMIFCASAAAAQNSKGYGLFHAESDDGCQWQRKGAVNLEGGDNEAWDSESRAYPSVFIEGGKIYLLYSGNANGKAGFGIAVRDYHG